MSYQDPYDPNNPDRPGYRGAADEGWGWGAVWGWIIAAVIIIIIGWALIGAWDWGGRRNPANTAQPAGSQQGPNYTAPNRQTVPPSNPPSNQPSNQPQQQQGAPNQPAPNPNAQPQGQNPPPPSNNPPPPSNAPGNR